MSLTGASAVVFVGHVSAVIDTVTEQRCADTATVGTLELIVETRYKDTLNTSTINHYARTVSEWSKDNTVSFGLRDMIRRFRDCLGR